VNRNRKATEITSQPQQQNLLQQQQQQKQQQQQQQQQQGNAFLIQYRISKNKTRQNTNTKIQ
jgi:hypothetical protein